MRLEDSRFPVPVFEAREEVKQLPTKNTYGGVKCMIPVMLALLLLINAANLGTVAFTLQQDAKSLRLVEAVLSALCHRMPSRSFWICEVPLGLCSRCTGVYLSAFLSAILLSVKASALPPGQLRVAVVFLVVLPIDGFLEHLGVYPGNNEIRFSTGVLFGLGLTSLQACLSHRFSQGLQRSA